MELQGNLGSLTAEGVRPYAISYDSVETLSAFADRHGITYPLLSDPDSKVISEFGILNTLVPKDHRWYGIPFPGTYMVDEHGVVFEKTFHADHVARDSISRMVQDTYNIDAPHGAVHSAQTPAYTVETYLTANTIRRGQVHTLTVDLHINDGYHVQAAPLPEGYIPLSVRIDTPDGVTANPIVYPETQPHRLPGLEDRLFIYDGTISIKTPILFNVREAVDVTVTIQAQACDDKDCLLPETHTFTLSTEWLPNP